MEMQNKIDHATQPNAAAPDQIAKRLLRTEREAEVATLGRMPLASMLTGAPLLYCHLDALPPGVCSVTLGQDPQLILTCLPDKIDDEAAVHAGGRYVARHGPPIAGGGYAVMKIEAARLVQGGKRTPLSPGALLTDGMRELHSYERSAVEHMNDDHLDAIKGIAERLLGAGPGEWRLASLDMEGLDLVRCDAAGIAYERLWFHPPLKAPEQIKSKLVELAVASRAT